MQYLTQLELKALLAAIPQQRHKLMVLVSYWHGLRATETISLTGRQIRGGYISVQRLKGSKKTVQPWVKHEDPDLDEAALLGDLAKTLGSDERLFPISRFGFYQLMRRAGERAGLPPHKRHPHVLKHTCAMVAIEGGIHHTRQYLGHKSLSSTGAYLQVSDEQASAAFREAVGKAK